MKIVIPVDNNSMDTNVCISFGRAPYFLIFDTETEENSFLDNSAAASQGGAGIKAAQNIVDSGAEAIVTPRCGDNAAEVIKAAGIKLYKTVNDSIQDNIKAFKEGKLNLLGEIHPGLHQHGGK
ncbi:NifB/NifX family molybdenum-iron cluster-binding protein [Dehalobacter restrictus]|uniref:Dinitrogenase iron-molybdenum cofactor biosynthesis protein n=1 Tax=Dehalobacter restrictus TaxID=55583 RepID=A0A857DDE0_9FIRM|nr:NifB/NifX family molybdenum-iron cluster-binding protein [Dehalobacter restrictus]QGZ99239.1 dinitrogenase iron-molybdenum cofactor biosynthesis protein [Dehalobacter restrictus]